MTYDEGLAQRVRDLFAGEAEVTEKRMFGGLAFLLSGNMTVAVGDEGLMFRIEPGTGAALVGGPVRQQTMGDRVMSGWLHVDTDGLETEAQLRDVDDRAKVQARMLPPK